MSNATSLTDAVKAAATQNASLTDAVNFLTQYENAGGDKPLLGGSITVSQDVLNYKGKRRDSLVGTLGELSSGSFQLPKVPSAAVRWQLIRPKAGTAGEQTAAPI